MQKPEQSTYLDPSYKRTSHGHKEIDGVQFHSYHVGIMAYARISEDGKIYVRTANARRDGTPTYHTSVVGHGTIRGRGDSLKRFRSEDAACRAGVKIMRERG